MSAQPSFNPLDLTAKWDVKLAPAVGGVDFWFAAIADATTIDSLSALFKSYPRWKFYRHNADILGDYRVECPGYAPPEVATAVKDFLESEHRLRVHIHAPRMRSISFFSL